MAIPATTCEGLMSLVTLIDSCNCANALLLLHRRTDTHMTPEMHAASDQPVKSTSVPAASFRYAPFPQTPSHFCLKLSVRINKVIYAARLKALRTKTTFPLVRNLFLCKPSSPTSLKNCRFPWCRRYALTTKTAAPYAAKRAPML